MRDNQGTNPTFTPVITSREREEMMTLAVRVWEALGSRDYARVDFRMDTCRPPLRARSQPEPRHQRRLRVSPVARRGKDPGDGFRRPDWLKTHSGGAQG